MIRNLKLSDIIQIEKSQSRDFPMPDLNDRSYIVQKTLLHHDEIVGACFARLTSEIILILDPKISGLCRTRLWREAAGEVFQELINRGIKSTHVFITPEEDEKHIKLLEEHFGFVRTTGTPLYLEVK